MYHRGISACVLVLSLAIYGLQQSDFSKDGQPQTVAERLRKHGIGLSEGELVEALRSPNAEIRGLAAAQLGGTRVYGATPKIMDAMGRETLPFTRIDMALALAWLGSDKGLEALRASCNNPTERSSVRMQAALYLLNLGDSSCFDAVVNLLGSDRESAAKIQAISLLPRFKDLSEANSFRVRALCVEHLHDPTPAVRLAAGNALVALGDGTVIPDLQRAIAAEGDDVVREQLKAELHQLEKKK